jgi:hypothetical protein
VCNPRRRKLRAARHSFTDRAFERLSKAGSERPLVPNSPFWDVAPRPQPVAPPLPVGQVGFDRIFFYLRGSLKRRKYDVRRQTDIVPSHFGGGLDPDRSKTFAFFRGIFFWLWLDFRLLGSGKA